MSESLTTSATGGFLPTLLEGVPHRAVVLALQATVVGVCFLAPTMVRPRWQPRPPERPPFGVDWCALGVTSVTPDGDAHMVVSPTDDQVAVQTAHETLEVMLSFYGPNAEDHARRLHAGLRVSQNRGHLRASGLNYVGVEPLRVVPELLAEQWANRVDLMTRFRREVVAEFRVLHLQSAQGIITGAGSSPWVVVES